MKVTLKYYEGLGKGEKKVFDIPVEEFETMIENDYQIRLSDAKEGEVVAHRTAQEIFDDINKQERNSWENHHRHLVSSEQEGEEGNEVSVLDLIADDSQAEAQQKRADYEELCKKIRQLLKPAQADMIIAICLDGMTVSDYAANKGEKLTAVSNRFVRAKNSLKNCFIQERN